MLISQLYYNAHTKREKLNILVFPYNGVFESELIKTGHNFYFVQEAFTYPCPFEPKINLISINSVKNYQYDLIIFNNRQQEQFFNLTRGLHVPGLVIDHDVSPHNSFFIKKHLDQWKLPSVATNEVSAKQFNSVKTINYTLPNIQGEFEKDIDILLVGTFPEQNYGFLVNLKNTFPTLRLFGGTQLPFSEPLDYNTYQRLFKRAKVFINLPLQLNLSYDLLLALNNCTVLTPKLPAYTMVNEKNCVLVDDINNIPSILRSLPKNLEKVDVPHSDITEWNEVFNQYGGIYA